MRYGLRIALVGWALLPAVWTPASASRASLVGRGLPPLLALDPSGMRLFPGSAADFNQQVLLDYSADTYDFSFYPYQGRIAQSDRFACALVGGSTRFAYVLDGVTHNLLVGTPGGFGVVVGMKDRYAQDNQVEYRIFNNIWDIYEDSLKVSETAFRLGASWETRFENGRLFQLAAGGSYFDSEVRVFRRIERDGEVTEDFRAVWQSDPGWGVDVTVRTLTDAEGFQGAVQYAHEDRNPTYEGLAFGEWKRQFLATDLGWRLTVPPLDDLVFGFDAYWQSETQPSSLGGSQALITQRETYAGGLFVSGEKEVIPHLVARAGLLGSGSFARLSRQTFDVSPDSTLTEGGRSVQEVGDLHSPQFFLGAGWSWKSFRFDAQIGESISLTYPFVRWSAVVFW